MNTLSSLLKFIANCIISLQDKSGGMNVKKITLPNVTIGAGTPSNPAVWTYDFSSKGVTGGIWDVQVTLNNRPLPYCTDSGNLTTWVSSISGTSITIRNTGTAWSNYTLYALIIHS